MPFITDTAMQKVATKLQSFETREEKRKIEVRQKLNEAKTVAESSLGAALVGFMHGRFEDADANFFIPRTSCQQASRSARSRAAWRSWPESRGAESQIRAGWNGGKLGLSAAGFG